MNHNETLESTPEIPFSVENQGPPLSPEDLRDINIGAYRFAQGIPARHTPILEYVRLYYGDRITDDALRQSLELSVQPISRFISRGAGLVHQSVVENESDIDTKVRGDLAEVAERWEEAKQPDLLNLPDVVGTIMKNSIGSDYKNLCQQGGRLGRGADERTSAHPHSRFLSQFAFYGLSRNTTGILVYDAMFRDTVAALDTYGHDWMDTIGATAEDALRKVLAVYAAHYPDEIQRLPDQWRLPPDDDSQQPMLQHV